jgi:hypothetical protein
MRKILLLLAFIGVGLFAKAQTNPFPTTDSLERFINRWIRNSPVEAFQNLRLNTSLIGMLRFIQNSGIGSGIDTAYSLNDSTFRLITFVPDTFDIVIRGATGGGSGDTTYTEKPVYVKTGTNDTLTLDYEYGLTIDADSSLMVDTSVIASIDTVFTILTRGIVVVDTIQFIHTGAGVTTYQNDKLIGSKLLQLSIESYLVGFLTRSNSVWMTFDPETGTITFTNGGLEDDDLVMILYRTGAIFVVDENGDLIVDENGNYIIEN